MRTTLLLLALLLPGCRTAFTPLGGPPHYDAPHIARVRAWVDGADVVFQASFIGSAHPHGAGWFLQIVMDADQAGNPFGGDYIVLGEDQEGQTLSVRQYTCCPTSRETETGKAQLAQEARSVTVAVPREAIGGDDGDLWFELTTYSQRKTVQRFTGEIKDGQGAGLSDPLGAAPAGSDAGVGWDQLLHQERRQQQQRRADQ